MAIAIPIIIGIGSIAGLALLNVAANESIRQHSQQNEENVFVQPFSNINLGLQTQPPSQVASINYDLIDNVQFVVTNIRTYEPSMDELLRIPETVVPEPGWYVINLAWQRPVWYSQPENVLLQDKTNLKYINIDMANVYGRTDNIAINIPKTIVSVNSTEIPVPVSPSVNMLCQLTVCNSLGQVQDMFAKFTEDLMSSTISKSAMVGILAELLYTCKPILVGAINDMTEDEVNKWGWWATVV